MVYIHTEIVICFCKPVGRFYRIDNKNNLSNKITSRPYNYKHSVKGTFVIKIYNEENKIYICHNYRDLSCLKIYCIGLLLSSAAHPLLKIEHYSISDGTIDHNNYSNHVFNSLNNFLTNIPLLDV